MLKKALEGRITAVGRAGSSPEIVADLDLLIGREPVRGMAAKSALTLKITCLSRAGCRTSHLKLTLGHG